MNPSSVPDRMSPSPSLHRLRAGNTSALGSSSLVYQSSILRRQHSATPHPPSSGSCIVSSLSSVMCPEPWRGDSNTFLSLKMI